MPIPGLPTLDSLTGIGNPASIGLRAANNRPSAVLPQEEEDSILSKIGSAGLSGLGWLGGTLDKALGGRAIRGGLDMLTGGDTSPRELLSVIPFSDTLGITDPSQQAAGRDIIENLGYTKNVEGFHPIDNPTDALGDVLGFATEVLTDPGTFVEGPISFLAHGAKVPTMGGKILKAAGQEALWKNAAAAAGKSTGNRMGRMSTTLGDVVNYAKQQPNAPEILDSLSAAAKAHGTDLADEMMTSQGLFGAVGAGLPSWMRPKWAGFSGKGTDEFVFGAAKARKALGSIDDLGDAAGQAAKSVPPDVGPRPAAGLAPDEAANVEPGLPTHKGTMPMAGDVSPESIAEMRANRQFPQTPQPANVVPPQAVQPPAPVTPAMAPPTELPPVHSPFAQQVYQQATKMGNSGTRIRFADLHDALGNPPLDQFHSAIDELAKTGNFNTYPFDNPMEVTARDRAAGFKGRLVGSKSYNEATHPISMLYVNPQADTIVGAAASNKLSPQKIKELKYILDDYQTKLAKDPTNPNILARVEDITKQLADDAAPPVSAAPQLPNVTSLDDSFVQKFGGDTPALKLNAEEQIREALKAGRQPVLVMGDKQLPIQEVVQQIGELKPLNVTAAGKNKQAAARAALTKQVSDTLDAGGQAVFVQGGKQIPIAQVVNKGFRAADGSKLNPLDAITGKAEIHTTPTGTFLKAADGSLHDAAEVLSSGGKVDIPGTGEASSLRDLVSSQNNNVLAGEAGNMVKSVNDGLSGVDDAIDASASAPADAALALKKQQAIDEALALANTTAKPAKAGSIAARRQAMLKHKRALSGLPEELQTPRGIADALPPGQLDELAPAVPPSKPPTVPPVAQAAPQPNPAPRPSITTEPVDPRLAGLGQFLDKGSNFIRQSGPGRTLAGLFSQPNMGAVSGPVQDMAQTLSRMKQESDLAVQARIQPMITDLQKAGLSDDIATPALRRGLEGLPTNTPALNELVKAGDQLNRDVLLRQQRAGANAEKLNDVVKGSHRQGIDADRAAQGITGTSKGKARDKILKGFVGGTEQLKTIIKEAGQQPSAGKYIWEKYGDQWASPRLTKAVRLITDAAAMDSLGLGGDSAAKVYEQIPYWKGGKETIDKLMDEASSLLGKPGQNEPAILRELIESHRAEWLAHPQEWKRQAKKLGNYITKNMKPSQKEVGLFDYHPLADLERGAKLGLHREAVARATQEHLPKMVADAIDAKLPSHEGVPVKSLLNKLALSTHEGNPFYAGIAKKLGVDTVKTKDWEKLVGEQRIPKTLATEILELNKGFTEPAAVKGAVKVYDSLTNLFKVGVLNWPARLTRDIISSTFMGFVMGKTSVRTIKAWRDVMQGQNPELLLDIPLVKSQLAKRGMEATPENAGTIFREIVAAENAVSPLDSALSNDNMAGMTRPALHSGARTTDDLLTARPGNEPFSLKTPAKIIKEGGVRGAANINFRGVSDLKGNVRQVTENTWGRAGEYMGNASESMNRGPVFLKSLLEGKSPRAAKMDVDLINANYAASHYTKTEQEVMMRLMPFYKYSRNMIPNMLADMAHRTGGPLAQLVKLYGKASDPRFTPEYISGGGAAIPIGQNDDGTQRYLSSFGLPVELLNAAHFGPGGMKKTGLDILGMSNPLIKAPLEQATGRQFYSDRDLRDLDPRLGRILQNVGLTDNARIIPQPVDQLLSNSPLARALSTAGTLTDPRKDALTKGVNLLTGLRLTDVDIQKQKEIETRRLVDELLRGEPGVRSYQDLYVKPGEEGNLSERGQQLFKVRRSISARANAAKRGKRPRKPKKPKAIKVKRATTKRRKRRRQQREYP